MKLLHTSDLRLGLAFPHLVERAEELRALRLEALRAVLALAAREGVAAVLLAGNTLADNRLAHRDLMDAVAVLGTSSVPVYLLPGLTDPDTPDSPYAVRADLFVAPIHVLRGPVEVGGLTLVPFPVRSREALPAWEGTGELAVACAPPPQSPHGFRYVAMGGSPFPEHHGAAHWCGTPEGYDYGHPPGAVTLIEDLQPRSVPTGTPAWPAAPPGEDRVLPSFHHPLLKAMQEEMRAADPEVAAHAQHQLADLVAGREDLL